MLSRPYRIFVVILSCAILMLLAQGMILAQEDPDPTPQFRNDIPAEESPGESADQADPIEEPNVATAVIVKDGSFENNPSDWEVFNQTPCPRIGNFKNQTGVTAKDGNKYLWVGGKCNGQPMGVNNAHQTVNIPSKDPVLTFYYYMDRTDPDGASPTSDLAYVRLNGTDVWTKPMTRANNTNRWVKATVDLGAFAGRERTLKMSGRNEDEPAGGHIYYDLVSIGSGTAPQEPVLSTKKYIVDDDKTNDSYGDNDGIAECGEIIELVITVENRGSAAANDFYMTVDTSDPYARLLFNPRAPQSGTERIAAGGTYINKHPHDFDFEIASNTPAGHEIRFDLTMRASNGGPWEKSIVVPITCGSGAPPPVPTLNAIDNGDKDGDYYVTWNKVNGATKYWLEEEKDNSGNWNRVHYASSNNPYLSGRNNSRYCYRVRSENANGFSGWSGEKCTTVDTYIVPPQLTSPSNNSTTTDTTPTFDWVAVGGAYEYQLQVDNNSGFGSPEINITRRNTQSSNYTPSSPLNPGTYYWRMRTYKNGTWSSWTNPVWKFTIQAGRPGTPALYNISNSDKDGSYTVDWSFVNTATSYQLDEKKDGGSWHGVYNDSATQKSFSGKADGRYCYRVLARNSSGDSSWSGEKCTIVDTYIVPPQLTSPSNNSTTTDTTPTFDWVAVGGAYEYQLQVDNNSGFGSPEINITRRNTQSSNYTPSSPLKPGTYYWRMRTYKNGTWSSWTNPAWKFTISGGRPEMDVRYFDNGQSIADGDTMPSENDGTDFGIADTNGGSVIHIFKIYNTGDGNLNLTASPTARLTGCDGFSMVELPDSPVVPGGSRVFSIEFDPSSTGDCTATLSIANNDADENPYNFTIRGKGKRVADVSITHIEVTQGIQNLANDMPLVADRRTAFRVYVRSDNGEVDPVCKVKVYAYLGGRFLGSKDASNNEKVKIYESKATDQYGGDRWRIDNSFWGLLPTNALAGSIRLRAELYCGDAVEDKNLTNNTKEEAVTFQKGDQLKLHFVSPYLKNKSGQTSIYRASGSGFYHVINNLYRFHPIASFSFTADPETVRNNGGTWNLSTKFNENRLVDRIALMNLFDGKSDTYWMGLIAQDVTTVRGGLAMVTSSWSKMNVDGRPKYPWSIYGGSTVAHELGHNKGLDHVDCDGTEDDTDNNYPWTNPCRLAKTDPNGFYGFDVYYDMWNLGAPTVITNNQNSVFPHDAYPMMGYKQPRWVSPYEYCKLLKKYGISCDLQFSSTNLLDSSQALTAGTDKQLEKLWFEREAVDQALVFTGFYDQTNASAVLLNTFVLEELPPGTFDAYRKQTATDSTNAIGLRAIGLSSSGKIITEREIAASTVPGSDNDLYYYQEILPFSSEITTLQIVTKDQTLATATASHYAPVVELLSPNGGERLEVGTVVKWNATDADDADGNALSFILQYSPDGGDSWQLVAADILEREYKLETLANIPGSTRGLMRVIASDGFYAPQDTSDGYFTVPDSPPSVHINQPLDGGLFEPAKTLILFGSAYDSEDGPLSGTNLEWFSDKDGELGQGSEVHIDNISAGQHSITLRAMDSTGKTTSATASIFVGYRSLLPNVIGR